ncbi:MAG: Zn-ribbon domain-containing OB-fold protein [Thermodesulfobacteriota bacterium]
MPTSLEDCFVVEGKLALPYQYLAGRTGSRFIIGLRDQKKIKGVRCDQCQKVFVPPRSTCERCFSDLTNAWVDLESTGTVTGFTVVRYAEPHQPFEPPFILALIKLDGADTPLAHVVRGLDASRIKVGLRVKAVFAEKSTSTIRDIDHFRPDLED